MQQPHTFRSISGSMFIDDRNLIWTEQPHRLWKVAHYEGHAYAMRDTSPKFFLRGQTFADVENKAGKALSYYISTKLTE